MNPDDDFVRGHAQHVAAAPADPHDLLRTDPFVRLDQFSRFDGPGRTALLRLNWREIVIDKGDRLATAGEVVDELRILTSGWLARGRHLQSGHRQIMRVLLPGDVASPDALIPAALDHDQEALTDVTVLSVPMHDVEEACGRARWLPEAMTAVAAEEAAAARQAVVLLGRYNALERMAYLLLDLHTRLASTGLADDAGFDLPVSQQVIGDVAGLSVVHTNKTLRMLEQRCLIRRQGRRVWFTDRAGLCEIADFPR